LFRPDTEIEPSLWSVTVMRGSRRAMSSSERLALAAVSSARPLMLVPLPLLSEENTLEAPVTTTADRVAGAADAAADSECSCASTALTWLRFRKTPFSLSVPTPGLFTGDRVRAADAKAAGVVAAAGVGDGRG
jgi:hypothetical protein